MKKHYSLLSFLLGSILFLVACQATPTNSKSSSQHSSVATTSSKSTSSSSLSSTTSTSSISTNKETTKQEKEENRSRQSESTIAKKHLLQVTPQIQQVSNYCAPTTVSMMLASRGIQVDQFQLATEMGTAEPFGTHNRDAIRILNRHLFGYETPAEKQAGYRLETVTTFTSDSEDMKKFKDRVRTNIKDGYPLYYTFDSSKVYPGKPGEHNVIGIGYLETADGQDISLLYYLDPSPNVQDAVYGGLKVITPEELLSAMLTCEEPNYGW
ncbi:C39 family peptidase [Streptococcus marmotae]|uniref:C39 family peptidase n=1 Tax=Streptococcus marmotae TaxID=1825069 RepID=UPI0008338E38|nr:C39 family peptidase [Streptococcus marmotae]